MNFHIQRNKSLIVFLIMISPVLTSSYLLPLAYSQEFSSYVLTNTSYGTLPGKLSWPSDVAVDQEGNVYVADTDNNRIQVFSSNGTFISGWGKYGGANGTLRSPEGIAIDPLSGNVYVADTDNNRIQVFSSNGTFISGWGRYDPRALNGSFDHPKGVAVDQEGNVYVADTAHHRIQVFSSNGTFISGWGKYGGANGTLRSPEGIAIDPLSGNVYVADTDNNRIQVFSSNGTFMSKWGTHSPRALNGSFSSPSDVTVDQEGNVYVADAGNNRIQVFSSNGTFMSKWGTYGRAREHLMSPEGIAIDPLSGNVYVADAANSRISVIFRPPISNVAFSSEEGTIYGNDTTIKIETIYDGLKYPTAIAFLGPDDILVLEKNEETVRRISNGQMLDEPVLDLRNTTEIRGCMCGIAVMQNENNGTPYAFVYYFQAEVTENDGETKFVNQLYRYNITNGKFTNPKLIFEMPADPKALHNGGKVMIGPDNNVYLTIGEINGYTTEAQNFKNGSLPDGSSSILRFTPNGEPVDGGLLGTTHPLNKYYAYGIRNSFGMNYDPISGNIWMTDNGHTCCDELNIVIPGFNGGFKKIMGSSYFFQGPFNLTDLEYFNGNGKYYDPIFEWIDPLGVTDLVFVPSDRLGKDYEGNLFVGEINYGYLYRFILNETRTGLLLNGSLSDGVANNNNEKLETAFARINGAMTDLEIGPDGLMYIVSPNGKIMRMEPTDTNEAVPP
jgi:DNA-binding beta-propeller fold protein YncE